MLYISFDLNSGDWIDSTLVFVGSVSSTELSLLSFISHSDNFIGGNFQTQSSNEKSEAESEGGTVKVLYDAVVAGENEVIFIAFCGHNSVSSVQTYQGTH